MMYLLPEPPNNCPQCGDMWSAINEHNNAYCYICGKDWKDMAGENRCLHCGKYQEYTGDYPSGTWHCPCIEDDIQAFDAEFDTPEKIDAYIRAAGYDPVALVMRMQQRVRLVLLESPLNEGRMYFRQELVNGIFEEDEPEN